jgi:hypothetical protein
LDALLATGASTTPQNKTVSWRWLWRIERWPFDPRWMLRSLAEKNPLVWMAEVNGLLVDLRNMPREVQEIAVEDLLIPYVPADRKKGDFEQYARSRSYIMTEDRSHKRLRKKARRGMRGWPVATIAFYGPNLSQATKVAVGIVPFENAEVAEMRDWKVDRGDIRADAGVAREILEFMEKHGVLSVAMTDGIIGCPHQEGIDYEGEWCPVCEFWRGRDRFTGQRVH